MSASILTIDRPYILAALENLVRIESVNPDLDATGSGEGEVATYLEAACRNLGLEATRHEPEPGRASVVGRLAGTGGGRSLMLNAHHDTVSLDGDPGLLEPKVEEGRLMGRGAYDMKAGLAASLGAVKALRDAGLHLAGDLLIAGVADEEYASLGTRGLLDAYRPDGAVVTEPSQLEICRAHKGFVWVEVTVEGRAAHGSQWREGVDANRRMGRLLVALDEFEARLQAEKQHPLLGPPNLHAATLHGGVGPSTYAERSVVCIERRTLPGENAAQVLAEVQGLIDSLTTADPSFKASCRVLLERPPFEVAADAPIVRVVEEACDEVLGLVPPHRGENPWMDSAFLAQTGVDTVVLGPIGGGAHASEEWVDLESVYRLAAILAETALRYCGRA